MKIYIVLTALVVFSVFGITASQSYSIENKSNSFSYYNKNCNNDKCTVIHCDNNHPCDKAGTSNSTTNPTKLSDNSVSDKKSDIMNMIKKLLDFH